MVVDDAGTYHYCGMAGVIAAGVISCWLWVAAKGLLSLACSILADDMPFGQFFSYCYVAVEADAANGLASL